MPPRNSNAALSATDLISLHRMTSGLVDTVPSEHKDLLLAIKLVRLDHVTSLVLTEAGRQRLEREDPRVWQCTP